MHLIGSSFEDVGTLIDGVSQQAVFFTLQLLCSPVQRFGDHTPLGDVTLEGEEDETKRKHITRI